MKKTIVLFCVLALCLFACGGCGREENTTNPAPTESRQPSTPYDGGTSPSTPTKNPANSGTSSVGDELKDDISQGVQDLTDGAADLLDGTDGAGRNFRGR